MPKFFVKNNQIQNEMITILGEDVNHIANVLRLKKEDEIIICDKDEIINYKAKIIEIQKEKVVCNIIEKLTNTTESSIEVSIFQGLPKSDKMEYIIQKATELGVKEVIPVAMKRCVVKIDEKDMAKKTNRWQKIAEVAAKQSGRDIIPKVNEIINFQKMKDVICLYDLFLVAYEEEKQVTLKQVLQQTKERLQNGTIKTEEILKLSDRKNEKDKIRIGVVIGPEGGLESKEVEELKQNGAKIITLGNRILRTETASLAILSNIIYEFEN